VGPAPPRAHLTAENGVKVSGDDVVTDRRWRHRDRFPAQQLEALTGMRVGEGQELFGGQSHGRCNRLDHLKHPIRKRDWTEKITS
jgi:hypothetical protein